MEADIGIWNCLRVWSLGCQGFGFFQKFVQISRGQVISTKCVNYLQSPHRLLNLLDSHRSDDIQLNISSPVTFGKGLLWKLWSTTLFLQMSTRAQHQLCWPSTSKEECHCVVFILPFASSLLTCVNMGVGVTFHVCFLSKSHFLPCYIGQNRNWGSLWMREIAFAPSKDTQADKHTHTHTSHMNTMGSQRQSSGFSELKQSLIYAPLPTLRNTHSHSGRICCIYLNK